MEGGFSGWVAAPRGGGDGLVEVKHTSASSERAARSSSHAVCSAWAQARSRAAAAASLSTAAASRPLATASRLAPSCMDGNFSFK